MAFESLGYLDHRGRCAESKGAIVTRKRLKGRKTRAEAKVKKAVRAACVRRDGSCRAMPLMDTHALCHLDVRSMPFWWNCDGKSEHAHMAERRRSQTRGEAPEKRHTTAGSLMLCTFHHDQYDGRAKPRLLITSLTNKGADGPLRFKRGKA